MEPSCGDKRTFIFERGESVHGADTSMQSPPIDGIPNDMIPKINMEFESEEHAYKFYNSYAGKVGFSIRRHKGHFDKVGKVLDRVFTCSKEGYRKNDKRSCDVKSPRAQSRFECPAELRVSARQNGKYRVYKFVAEHSHPLASPDESHLLRSQRGVTEADMSKIDMREGSGITPKESMELFSREAGGREKVGFIPIDYKNYLRTKRMIEMRTGDTGGVFEYLQKMQEEDPCFSYAIQVDVDDLVTNIFWADGRMKMDYSIFGDVMCFDTTFRKNKEGRPFALFVGVNHHKQTVIFGAALLYDETTETFEWLFSTFCKVMFGKKPITILTDQDAAMAKALANKWPKTTHRLCVWHIYQNAARHLSSVFGRFKSFARDFSSCIYDHDEVPDFLNAWKNMIEKYELQSNHWLNDIFKLKEKWALVYGRNVFCAGMSTTQRSESMNNQLKKYVSCKHDLLRFFHHFQRLVEDRRYEELKADFKATQTIPSSAFPVEILKHVANLYTPAVYKLFYEELWKTWNCDIDSCGESGTASSYKVTSNEMHHQHLVMYDSTNQTISCSCKKFEFVGILCAHALKVFSIRNVKKVPEQYILKRWTKTAKVEVFGCTHKSISDETPKEGTSRRYKELYHCFNQLVTIAAKTEETYEIAMGSYSNAIADIEEKLRSMSIDAHVQKDHGSVNTGNKDLDRNTYQQMGINLKGIKVKQTGGNGGSSKRKINALEKAVQKKRAPKAKASESNMSIPPTFPKSDMHGDQFPLQNVPHDDYIPVMGQYHYDSAIPMTELGNRR